MYEEDGLNATKSKVMQISRNEGEIRITCNGEVLECLDSYEYLSSIVSKGGRVGTGHRN